MPALKRPTTTPVPDEIFDVYLPDLSEAELKVLLYLVRRTLGFGKSADAVSLRQLTGGITTRGGAVLDRGTGLSRRACVAAVGGLERRGLIAVERQQSAAGDSAVNVYQLVWETAGVQNLHGGGDSRSLPPGYPESPRVVTQMHPQETVLQETAGQAPGAPEDAAEYAALWATVLAQLQAEVTRANFETYLAGTELVACTATTATVRAPTRTAAAALTARWRPRLGIALGRALGRPVTCCVTVASG